MARATLKADSPATRPSDANVSERVHVEWPHASSLHQLRPDVPAHVRRVHRLTGPQYATVNTTGTVNSYGSTGYANGTYNATSTVAMPGGYSTYSIPYNISRNDFFASFWAARSPEKMRLGVNPVALPDQVRQRLQRNTGVVAAIVVRETPAFRANILEGDVITKINGADVIDPKSFSDQLTQFAGQTVELSIIRGEDHKVVRVTLNPNPPGVH